MPLYQVADGWVAGRSRIVHATAEDAARFAMRRRARVFARDQVLLGRRADAKRPGGPFSGRVPRFSDRLEQMHAGMLQSRWKLLFDLVMQVAGPGIREQSREIEAWKQGLRTDARRLDASPSVADVVLVVRSLLDAMIEEDEEGLDLIGREIDEDTTDATDRELSALLNVPISSQVPSPDVKKWVMDNVVLERALLDKGLDALERTADEVIAAVGRGKPTLDLAKEYQRRFDLTWNKASYLARDQTANLSSRIAQQRMEDLGVEEYQWSTSGDSRVRQAHADLDGNIYRFDDPPVADRKGTRGNPGEVWQCRCIARPRLDMSESGKQRLIAEADARKEWELMWMAASPTVRGEIPNQSSFRDWNAKRISEIRRGVRSSVGL